MKLSTYPSGKSVIVGITAHLSLEQLNFKIHISVVTDFVFVGEIKKPNERYSAPCSLFCVCRRNQKARRALLCSLLFILCLSAKSKSQTNVTLLLALYFVFVGEIKKPDERYSAPCSLFCVCRRNQKARRALLCSLLFILCLSAKSKSQTSVTLLLALYFVFVGEIKKPDERYSAPCCLFCVCRRNQKARRALLCSLLFILCLSAKSKSQTRVTLLLALYFVFVGEIKKPDERYSAPCCLFCVCRRNQKAKRALLCSLLFILCLSAKSKSQTSVTLLLALYFVFVGEIKKPNERYSAPCCLFCVCRRNQKARRALLCSLLFILCLSAKSKSQTSVTLLLAVYFVFVGEIKKPDERYSAPCCLFCVCRRNQKAKRALLCSLLFILCLSAKSKSQTSVTLLLALYFVFVGEIKKPDERYSAPCCLFCVCRRNQKARRALLCSLLFILCLSAKSKSQTSVTLLLALYFVFVGKIKKPDERYSAPCSLFCVCRRNQKAKRALLCSLLFILCLSAKSKSQTSVTLLLALYFVFVGEIKKPNERYSAPCCLFCVCRRNQKARRALLCSLLFILCLSAKSKSQTSVTLLLAVYFVFVGEIKKPNERYSAPCCLFCVCRRNQKARRALLCSLLFILCLSAKSKSQTSVTLLLAVYFVFVGEIKKPDERYSAPCSLFCVCRRNQKARRALLCSLLFILCLSAKSKSQTSVTLLLAVYFVFVGEIKKPNERYSAPCCLFCVCRRNQKARRALLCSLLFILCLSAKSKSQTSVTLLLAVYFVFVGEIKKPNERYSAPCCLFCVCRRNQKARRALLCSLLFILCLSAKSKSQTSVTLLLAVYFVFVGEIKKPDERYSAPCCLFCVCRRNQKAKRALLCSLLFILCLSAKSKSQTSVTLLLAVYFVFVGEIKKPDERYSAPCCLFCVCRRNQKAKRALLCSLLFILCLSAKSKSQTSVTLLLAVYFVFVGEIKKPDERYSAPCCLFCVCRRNQKARRALLRSLLFILCLSAKSKSQTSVTPLLAVYFVFVGEIKKPDERYSAPCCLFCVCRRNQKARRVLLCSLLFILCLSAKSKSQTSVTLLLALYFVFVHCY